MGGGDLNLKKSWHPSTLRNIERVWKAEQKHEVEQQKIEQLQKELADERAKEEIQAFAEDQGVVRKKDEKLDWMYQGPAAMVNRDEYLLGKKIDKTLETLTQIEKGVEPEKDDGVGIASISMFSSQNLSGNATVDLATKIREDPLFSIMKKEKEERKNLLTNPVKMKQLQEILKASLSKSKNKKSKKNKKKKHQDSDSEEETRSKKQRKHADSDEEKQRKRHNKTKNYYSSESEEEKRHSFIIKHKKQGKLLNETYEPSYKKDKKAYQYAVSYHANSKESQYSKREAKTRHRSHYTDSDIASNHQESRNDMREKRNIHQDYKSKKRSYDSELESESKDRKNRKSPAPDYPTSKYRSSYYIEDASDKNNRSKPVKKKEYSRQDDKKTDRKRQVDAEERDRLLKEMQENAKWRDEQRRRNTLRYKDEEEKERENTVEKVNSDAFLKPILSKAAGKGNLEDRLKQKIFTLQRSSSAMDKNFARRD